MTTIHPDTLAFLRDLSQHNDRDWFQEHKARYTTVWNHLKQVAEEIKEALNATDVIDEAKVFRIYRDVRFSKNKLPYKDNLGVSFQRAGALRRGGYYLHLQPGQSFLAGGFWAPERDDLKRIREEMTHDAASLRQLVAQPDFVHHFGGLTGDELKTAPAGFDRDHPDIDLIRKKQYLAQRSFTDAEVLATDFLPGVVASFRALRPWFDYMSEVLTTNADGERIV